MPTINEKKLRIAAGHGDTKTIRALAVAGTNLDVKIAGDTALHVAAATGKDRAAAELVKAGADINALDADDCTPLMVACTKGQTRGSKVALVLIELGADAAYVRREDGASALSLAVERAEPEVLRALIAHGAKVDGRRGQEITPLMEAAAKNRVEAAKVLLEVGADLTRKCRLPWAKGKTAYEIAVQESSKAVAALIMNASAGAAVKGRKKPGK